MAAVRAGQERALCLDDERSPLRGWRVEAAAALFAIVLYLPSLGFPLLFDDHALIDPDGIPRALGALLPYRPVRYLSYRIDAALGGAPLVYHAHSVLLFALLIAMVARLARRLGAGPVAALIGALALAAHPLAVEVAAYVAGRRDLLAAVFGLGAMLAWFEGRRVLATALLLLAAGSKESALLGAPVIMLATLCGVAAPGRGDRCLPAVAALAAVALVFAYGAVGPWTPPREWAGLALPGRVVLHYADHLLRPLALAGAGLSTEYPELGSFIESVRDGGLVATVFALACASITLLVAAAVCAVAVLALRRGRSDARHTCSDYSRAGISGDGSVASSSRCFVAGWLALAVAALALWGGLHEPGADRHALVVLPAAAVALALALSGLQGRRRAAALATSVVALIALTASTVAQVEVWRDDRALWLHTVATRPDAVRARLNLAAGFAAEGRYRKAAHQLDQALRRRPDFGDAYLGRAVLRCAQRRTWAARRDLRRAQSLGVESASVDRIASQCPLPESAVSSSGAAAVAASPLPPPAATGGREKRT